ncbi:hypothetical protein ACIOHC_36100 [Streptomyces sp. NPDC088252]|uniref:hypothetical protein n=1 Tax=Streptomyces sp. NPDC088252 TaxID=3365845 RepID=UPI00382C4E40
MKLAQRLTGLVSPLRRRVRSMPAEQMGVWLDVAGSEMSRAFTDYLRTREASALAEFDRGVATLVAMSDELHRRRNV